MTIAATLDLDKAIETFKNTMQWLLQWGDLSEWDGQRFKQLEEQLRKMGLELAGQCIALILQQLSEDRIAQIEANRRTNSSRGFGSQSQGRQRVKMVTLGNVEVSLAVTYVLNRSARVNQDKQRQKRKPGQRGQSQRQGFYPLLQWLAMEERVTPLVWSTVAAQGMLSASFAVACANLKDWGICLSEQRIERLTYRFGQVGVNLSEQWIEQLQQAQLPVGETLRGQRVGLHVDGGRTSFTAKQKGQTAGKWATGLLWGLAGTESVHALCDR